MDLTRLQNGRPVAPLYSYNDTSKTLSGLASPGASVQIVVDDAVAATVTADAVGAWSNVFGTSQAGKKITARQVFAGNQGVTGEPAPTPVADFAPAGAVGSFFAFAPFARAALPLRGVTVSGQLPDGANFSSRSALISGTLRSDGPWSATITATDANGAAVSWSGGGGSGSENGLPIPPIGFQLLGMGPDILTLGSDFPMMEAA